MPGGARDSHETAEEAAVREAGEEAGVSPAAVTIRSSVVTKRVQGSKSWTYTTVIADTRELLPTAANGESVELRWVPEGDVGGMPLHPGFEASWPELRCVQVLDRAPQQFGGQSGPGTFELEPGRFAWLMPPSHLPSQRGAHRLGGGAGIGGGGEGAHDDDACRTRGHDLG